MTPFRWLCTAFLVALILVTAAVRTLDARLKRLEKVTIIGVAPLNFETEVEQRQSEWDLRTHASSHGGPSAYAEREWLRIIKTPITPCVVPGFRPQGEVRPCGTPDRVMSEVKP